MNNGNDLVIIELDRPRVLKFNHTALKTLVALTGKELEDLEQELTPENFELIEKLAYCGLLKDAKDHGETLTPDKAVELLDDAPVFSKALEKIFAAWGAAFGAIPAQSEGNAVNPEGKQVKGTTSKKASE